MKSVKTTSFDKNYKMSKPTKSMLALYYDQEQRLFLKRLMINAENHALLVKKSDSIKKVELPRHENTNSSLD